MNYILNFEFECSIKRVGIAYRIVIARYKEFLDSHPIFISLKYIPMSKMLPILNCHKMSISKKNNHR